MKENRKNISNVPNLRFPEFNEEWETISLENFSDKIGDGIHSTPEYDDSGDYSFINGNNFVEGKIKISESTKKVSKTEAQKHNINNLVENSILISINGTIGSLALYNNEPVMLGKSACYINPKVSQNKLFAFYQLGSSRVYNYFISELTGTTIKNLSLRSIRNTVFHLPIYEEQAKIASFLSLIDERISTQSKIIDRLESLIKGIIQTLMGDSKVKPGWRKLFLRDILTESKELNQDYHPVFSVSVSKGVINQIDYLGRSFAAQNTSNYNVVHFGDIVYTKSPTGKFPYGIVKQSLINEGVAVSPLYGVYKPKSTEIGNVLHHYFNNPINTNNYLHSLIQKGAKNTINITNQNFLNKEISLPIDDNEIKIISDLLESLSYKINLESNLYDKLKEQKQYLLRQMFI